MTKVSFSATLLFLSLSTIIFWGATQSSKAGKGCCGSNSVGDGPTDSSRARNRNNSTIRVSPKTKPRVDISYLKGLEGRRASIQSIARELEELPEKQRASVKKTYKFFFDNQTSSSLNIWNIMGWLIALPKKHLDKLPSLYYTITSIKTGDNGKIRIELNNSQKWTVATSLIQISPEKRKKFLKEVMTEKRKKYLSKESKDAFVNYLVQKVKRNVDSPYQTLDFEANGSST